MFKEISVCGEAQQPIVQRINVVWAANRKNIVTFFFDVMKKYNIR